MSIPTHSLQQPNINGTVPHLVSGPSPLTPLMNGRGQTSLVSDGSEPRMVTYFAQMKVLSVAAGKNHMLAITDNGVSRGIMMRVIWLSFLEWQILVDVHLFANDLLNHITS